MYWDDVAGTSTFVAVAVDVVADVAAAVAGFDDDVEVVETVAGGGTCDHMFVVEH